MDNKRHLSASLIAADFMHLADQINAVIDAGADSIHFDVMDHHYVPNLSIGPMVCHSIHQKMPSLPLDVHLMVTNPEDYILPFSKAGAARISIHPSTATNTLQCLQTIRDNGMQAGVVFNPDEPTTIEKEWLPYLDHLLLMSVKPGFGGQSFMPCVLEKLRDARQFIDTHARHITLAVDGGINADNIGLCAAAGADFFVVGSALFHRPPYEQTIQALRAE